MAVKITANYSKRLGLPGYSSHQFSVSVEVELNNTDDVKLEASRLYQALQSSVDREIQHTGFVPDGDYGTQIPAPAPVRQLPNNRQDVQWKASDKQKELILKLIKDNHLELETVETLAEEMFGNGNLPTLNKIQSSGLIDELLSRYGKKPRRDSAPAGGWNRRAS
ncbi:MAG: hypothetical protein WCO60_11495 [Verrucomicrobiota bacterium]